MATHRVQDIRVWPECKLTHPRVQSVRADDQIDVARLCMIEFDPRACAMVIDRRNAVAEDRFHPCIQRVMDGGRDIGARQGRDAPVRKRPQRARWKASARSAECVHHPDFVGRVLQLQKTRQQAHPFHRVVANAPQVEHVAAGAQRGRLLDQQHIVAESAQPEGECRTGDTGAIDGHPHRFRSSKFYAPVVQPASDAGRDAVTPGRSRGSMRASVRPG